MATAINVYINVVDKREKSGERLQPDTGVYATILPERKRVLVTVLPPSIKYPTLEYKLDEVTVITGYRPDFYIRTDFDAFEDVINAIRGIEIETDKNYKIGDVYYKKGLNKMTGHHAMALFKKKCKTEEELLNVRESVVEGFIRKMLKGFSLTYDYGKLYNIAKTKIETNINSSIVKKLAKKQNSGSKNWKVFKQYILESSTDEEINNALEKIKVFNI